MLRIEAKNKVTSLLEETPGLLSLIHYGSSLRKETPNDYDFMAIYDNNQQIESIKLGKIDICKISKLEFNQRLLSLDPIYCTEPLQTGEFLAGDLQAHNQLVNTLNQIKPNPQKIHYLISQSLIQYLNSINLNQVGDYPAALFSIKFSLGYYMFANWYIENANIPTFEMLEKKYQFEYYTKLLSQLEKAKKHQSIEKNEIDELLNEFSSLLASANIFS